MTGLGAGFKCLAAFSPDRRTVIWAQDDGPIGRCDVSTGRVTTLPLLHRAKVTALSVRPDGKVSLVGDASGMVRLWDVATGTARGEPLRHEGSIVTAAFSPDGRSVVTAGDDRTTRLWDATTGRPIAPLLENEGPVVEVAFSADGGVIAVRTAHSIRTFARFAGQSGVKPLGPPWEPRNSEAEWVSDGRAVVTLKPERIRPLHVEVMALSPDGRKLMATCEGDEARVWRTLPAVGRCPAADALGGGADGPRAGFRRQRERTGREILVGAPAAASRNGGPAVAMSTGRHGDDAAGCSVMNGSNVHIIILSY